MSVEWGRPVAPQEPESTPVQSALPAAWNQVAGAFPAWTLEPPRVAAPRGNKPAA